MNVSVADAKNKLTQLMQAVEAGESVTICRRGQPVIDLVPTKQSALTERKLGTLRDRVEILDPNWDKPMTDEEFAAFVEGRY
jgi:prevent-host-death family protein